MGWEGMRKVQSSGCPITPPVGRWRKILRGSQNTEIPRFLQEELVVSVAQLDRPFWALLLSSEWRHPVAMTSQ